MDDSSSGHGQSNNHVSSSLRQSSGNRGDGSDAGRLEDEPEPPDSALAQGLKPHIRSNSVSSTNTTSVSSSIEADEKLQKPAKRHDSTYARHTVVSVSSIQQQDDVHGSRSATGAVTTDLHQPHTLSVKECIEKFSTNAESGLSKQDADLHLARNGPNTIREAETVSMWTILLRQIANALTVILLAAMALSFGVRDWVEGGVVSAVIAVNVSIGFM